MKQCNGNCLLMITISNKALFDSYECNLQDQLLSLLKL